jgi:hypothetical protein
MDLTHPNLGMLSLVGVGLLASFWVLFRLAWKVVQIGFFLIAFAVGFAVCAGLSAVSGHPQPIWALGAEALAVAWGYTLVRGKIAKLITGLAIVTVAQLVGKFGFDPSHLKDLDKAPIPLVGNLAGPQTPKPTPKTAAKPSPEKKPTKKAATKKTAAKKPVKKKPIKKKPAQKSTAPSSQKA